MNLFPIAKKIIFEYLFAYNFATELKNKYGYDFKLDQTQMLNFLTVLGSNYDVKEESNNTQPKESKTFT